MKLNDQNFYEKTLEDIDKLISKREYGKALKLVEEELAIPYVPSNYEAKFNLLKQKLDSLLLENSKQVFLSDQDLHKIAHKKNVTIGDVELFLGLIETFNIVNFVEDFELLFSKVNDKKLKIDLLQVLIKYKVDHDFNIDFGTIQTYNPSKTKALFETDIVAHVSNMISTNLEEKNITQRDMALNIFEEYLTYLYPTLPQLKDKDAIAAVCLYLASFYLKLDLSYKHFTDLLNVKEDSFLLIAEQFNIALKKRTNQTKITKK